MVQPSISVRQAVSTDIKYAEQAAKVVNDAYRTEGGWTTEKHIIVGPRVPVEVMAECIENSGKQDTLLLAFADDTVVGTVLIQPKNQLPGEAEIGMFSVSPLHQSRGIGGNLMQNAFLKMRDLGLNCAMLHVLENRPEILTWYQKLGFVETGEREPFPWPERLIVDKDLHTLTLKKSLK